MRGAPWIFLGTFWGLHLGAEGITAVQLGACPDAYGWLSILWGHLLGGTEGQGPLGEAGGDPSVTHWERLEPTPVFNINGPP